MKDLTKYRNIGIFAHVDAGIRLRLAIIDDPFKGRAAAESKANREAVFQAIEDDVRPRLLPDGCVVLVHTRWHPDDAPPLPVPPGRR